MTPGKQGTARTVVTTENTAKAIGSGNLEVFATPMMVALMEEAACNCIADVLSTEQSSVGTAISVAHTAPSRIGATITATAVLEEADGRKVVFTVTACDDTGEIGTGTHTRFIVDAQRFMQKVAER